MVGGLVMGALEKLCHQPSLGAAVLLVVLNLASLRQKGYTQKASFRTPVGTMGELAAFSSDSKRGRTLGTRICWWR
jgi:hypothetical protein